MVKRLEKLGLLLVLALVLAGCGLTASPKKTEERSDVGQADTEVNEAENSELMEPKGTGEEQMAPGGLETAAEAGAGDGLSFTLAELSEHDRADDCWLAIEGQVYDVTEFVASHPGGVAILQGCGREATQLFKTRPMGSGTPHSDTARSLLPEYEIGKLVN